MHQATPVVMVLGVLGLIGGIIWLAWYMDKKRREAFQAFAHANGFRYEGEGLTSILDELAGFKIFKQGHSRKVKNVLTGQRDWPMVLCDYQYTTGHGKNRTTHVQTLAMVKDEGGPGSPQFFVRRQVAFFDAIGKLFGGQDINFEDDPAFSKAFVLQGVDEAAVRRFFTPRIRAFFTESKERLVVENGGGRLVVHFGRAVKPEELNQLITTAVNLRRHWS